MSPHKPDPLPRKIDVDLSAILIRADEINRPGGYDLEPSTISAEGWKNSSGRGNASWITLPEWASIFFALSACFVGVFCTFWTFDDFAQFNRLVYPAADAIYVRPEWRPAKSRRVVSKRPHFPVRTQSNESSGNVIKDAPDVSNPAPPLSMFSPLFGNNNAPLLSNNGSPTGSSPGSSQSTGPGRSSMSEGSGPSAQGKNSPHKIGSKQSTAKQPMMHSPKSIMCASPKTLSARQTARASQASSAKMLARLSHPAMMSHSMKGGTDIFQNRMEPNGMRMQHGMIAQPSVGAGVNAGLNGGGLGGGGGGRHGANARH